MTTPAMHEPFSSAKERYRNDPLFHRLVDVMRSLLHGNQATPSELREALMLAAYCEEMENPGPALHRIDSLRRILDDDRAERAPVPVQAPAPVRICGATYCSDGNAGGHAGVEFSECGRPAGHPGPWGDVPGTKCRRRPQPEDLVAARAVQGTAPQGETK